MDRIILRVKRQVQILQIRDAKTNKAVAYPVHVDKLKRCYDNRDQFLTDYNFNQNASADQEGNAEEIETEVDTEVQETIEKEQEQERQLDIEEKGKKDEQGNDKKPGKWFRAIELVGLKYMNGKRHYKVRWAKRSEQDSWHEENDVSDCLKRNYHIKRTMQGTLRKQFKRNKKQY